jgi:hypothetical protein
MRVESEAESKSRHHVEFFLGSWEGNNWDRKGNSARLTGHLTVLSIKRF